MNYERLTKLAALLDQHHGAPSEYGFIVGPHSHMQFLEHKNALVHSDRMFNYQPIADEKLCIYSVRRSPAAGDGSAPLEYHSTPLEHVEIENPHAEVTPLLNEYREFVRARLE